MKRLSATLTRFLVLGLVFTGCILDEETEVVLTEKFCVNFDERQEEPTLRSEVVCDQFRVQIEAYLEDNEIDPEDIISVGIVSATYHVSRISGKKGPAHDWIISGFVSAKRQDDPDGPIDDGPATFVDFTEQSLKDAQGKPTPANLNGDGVAVIDRALEALIIGGEDPRIVLTLENSDVVPTPTPEDAMDFKWRACVTLQTVVRTSLDDNQSQ
jgi:hypothetical protein